MADRRLLIGEFDPADGNYGEMFGLQPNNATGVAIPAFSSGAVTPRAGTVAGEAFINTTNHQAFVWSGIRWEPIAESAVATYTTDAAILADNAAAVGSYASSQATGNLFLRYNDGVHGDQWRQVGVRIYPTQAGMLTDSPPAGSLAWCTDTRLLFVKGTSATQWIPSSTWLRTEAQILARTTDNVKGQVAVSTDTSRIFIWDAAAGAWVSSPLRNYTTEALMIADTPPNGTMGIALDTGHAGVFVSGAWVMVNPGNASVRVVATDPATATAGDLIYNSTSKVLKVYTGAGTTGAWIAVGVLQVPFATTAPPGVNGLLYYNTTENKVKFYDGSVYKNLAAFKVSELEDVDVATTAPVDGDVLVYNATQSKWLPRQSLVVGAEPATAKRFNGLLWHDGVRLWIWLTAAGTWVEI